MAISSVDAPIGTFGYEIDVRLMDHVEAALSCGTILVYDNKKTDLNPTHDEGMDGKLNKRSYNFASALIYGNGEKCILTASYLNSFLQYCLFVDIRLMKTK